MGIFIVFVLTLLLLGQNVFGGKQDDSFSRCAESCLQINPYESSSKDNLVKHCAKLTNDGRCECDWEKVLTVSGECVCRNPKHTINAANECACDTSLCEPPMSNCKGKITSEEDPFGCCNKYFCDVCPSDSYPSNATNSCVCFPCQQANCKDNQTTVVIRKAANSPGSCCDLYICEDVQNKTCESNLKVYQNGESWLQNDCAQYRCDNGVIFNDLLEGCDVQILCFSKDNVYANGQSWLEDECTNCTCVKGLKKCVSHFCEESPSATIKPYFHCPSMDFCKKTCAFGFKLSRRGCETCRCRLPDPWVVHELLRVVNCSLEECELMRVLPVNYTAANGSNETCPQCADAYTQLLPILVGVIVFLVVMLAAMSGLWYRERRRGVCTLQLHQTPSPEHKYNYIPMLDANLNAEKSILCAKKPNVELKGFHR